MDLLLTQPDIIDDDDDDDDESDHENESNDNNTTVDIKRKEIRLYFILKVPERIPLFSRNGPFISFRKFRQQRFQANAKVRK